MNENEGELAISAASGIEIEETDNEADSEGRKGGGKEIRGEGEEGKEEVEGKGDKTEGEAGRLDGHKRSVTGRGRKSLIMGLESIGVRCEIGGTKILDVGRPIILMLGRANFGAAKHPLGGFWGDDLWTTHNYWRKEGQKGGAK